MHCTLICLALAASTTLAAPARSRVSREVDIPGLDSLNTLKKLPVVSELPVGDLIARGGKSVDIPGVESLEALKTLPFVKDLPISGLVGRGDKDDKEDLESGATPFSRRAFELPGLNGLNTIKKVPVIKDLPVGKLIARDDEDDLDGGATPFSRRALGLPSLESVHALRTVAPVLGKLPINDLVSRAEQDVNAADETAPEDKAAEPAGDDTEETPGSDSILDSLPVVGELGLGDLLGRSAHGGDKNNDDLEQAGSPFSRRSNENLGIDTLKKLPLAKGLGVADLIARRGDEAAAGTGGEEYTPEHGTGGGDAVIVGVNIDNEVEGVDVAKRQEDEHAPEHGAGGSGDVVIVAVNIDDEVEGVDVAKRQEDAYASERGASGGEGNSAVLVSVSIDNDIEGVDVAKREDDKANEGKEDLEAAGAPFARRGKIDVAGFEKEHQLKAVAAARV
jgi:hypothetical protein